MFVNNREKVLYMEKSARNLESVFQQFVRKNIQRALTKTCYNRKTPKMNDLCMVISVCTAPEGRTRGPLAVRTATTVRTSLNNRF